MNFNPEEHPHRRFNPLSGEWVLVSPHRTKRPWLGQQEKSGNEVRPPYDPTCYLCPGNARAAGTHNPPYTGVFVFTNDFSALLPDTPMVRQGENSLFQEEAVQGECRVICFSPRHDLTLAEMSREEIGAVVQEWAHQAEELSRTYQWVQIFENKGAVMGCSNPHPHGQVWASSSLPTLVANEDQQQREYWQRHQRPLLFDYVESEQQKGDRVVVANESWVALVPFWAVWPFEILLLPRRAVRRLPELTAGERTDLADILKRLLVRYDNLFETAFPYSMGWHGAPGMGPGGEHWQLHAHFYPPLLRSATVRKFMVGYEMLGEPQRDMTPEQAARRLRETSESHYRQRPAA